MITYDNISARVTVARLIFIVYIDPLTTMIVFYQLSFKLNDKRNMYYFAM